MNTVDVEISIQRRSRPKPIPVPAAPRIPRITRLMALAIKFQAMIEHGEVRDYADLARLGYVTRARLTQIMNLLHLAPEIQDEILFPETAWHRMPERERLLRPLTSIACWSDQRAAWQRLRQTHLRSIPSSGQFPLQ